MWWLSEIEMRVAIASLGSRGDFQPMAALAVTLARRGHDVRLIAPRGYEEFVGDPGVNLRMIDYDVRAELSTAEGRQLLHSGQHRGRVPRFAGDRPA
jgi:UDP:flavonoid glycosyltransferase YjiC (YdhE family)